MHRQLLRELKFLDECTSPYIVRHFGSFLAERDTQVCILMEYAEGGSLDSLVAKMRQKEMRCSEHVLGRIAASVSRLPPFQARPNSKAGPERARLLAQTSYRSSRYQAQQYPAHTRRQCEAVRLWCQWGDHRLGSRNFHRYKLLHGREFLGSSVTALSGNVRRANSISFSPSEYKAGHTPSRQTSGLSVSHYTKSLISASPSRPRVNPNPSHL